MNKYSRIFKYLGQYKGQIVLYFFFIILSIIFSIISIGMLMPFMELIFKGDEGSLAGMMKETNNPLIKFLRDFLLENIRKNGGGMEGKLKTLGLLCIIIIVSIFLKNLFLYLSFYVLNPMKNRVVNQLRSDLYYKILHLPIGFLLKKEKEILSAALRMM